jgi:PIN domain nuclease of toxin-antitoxin system
VKSAPLLDTHAWIWWVVGDDRLGKQTLRRLDRLPPDTRPVISDVSLWEVAMLVASGRVEFSTAFEAWLERAAHPDTVRVLPITAPIAG